MAGMRALERLINVTGWPAIGWGAAHWFGPALVLQIVFASIGLLVGLAMPPLIGGVPMRAIGADAQPFECEGVERRSEQEAP
jgi:hypothetical protein